MNKGKLLGNLIFVGSLGLGTPLAGILGILSGTLIKLYAEGFTNVRFEAGSPGVQMVVDYPPRELEDLVVAEGFLVYTAEGVWGYGMLGDRYASLLPGEGISVGWVER